MFKAIYLVINRIIAAPERPLALNFHQAGKDDRENGLW